MRGVTGPPISVDLYYVTITFGPYVIYGIEVVALPIASESILGAMSLINWVDPQRLGAGVVAGLTTQIHPHVI